MKEKTVIELDYHELDKIINEHYDLPTDTYECVAYEEWDNYDTIWGEVHQVDLTRAHDVVFGSREHEILAKLRQGQPTHFSLDTILTDLVKAGKLKPAEYVIHIYW